MNVANWPTNPPNLLDLRSLEKASGVLEEIRRAVVRPAEVARLLRA
jgi:hypothetical protein